MALVATPSGQLRASPRQAPFGDDAAGTFPPCDQGGAVHVLLMNSAWGYEGDSERNRTQANTSFTKTPRIRSPHSTVGLGPYAKVDVKRQTAVKCERTSSTVPGQRIIMNGGRLPRGELVACTAGRRGRASATWPVSLGAARRSALESSCH